MNYFWINSKINRMNHIKACHEKTVWEDSVVSVSFCKLKHATYHIYPYIVDVSICFSWVCHGIWAVPNTDTSRWALLERIHQTSHQGRWNLLELVSWKSHLNLLSFDGATLVFGGFPWTKMAPFRSSLELQEHLLMVSAFLSIDSQHCLISLRSHWLKHHASQKGVHWAFFHVLT